MDIQPQEALAGERTDRSNDVASKTSPILELDDRLGAVFERCRNLQPLHQRYAPAHMRPDRPGIRKQRLTVKILGIALEQSQAMTIQNEFERGVILLAALREFLMHA
ncbi:hypothetical protein GGD67_002265 [Bradyrhizobium sp. IAR9]|uniref:hypothetical protein n=1 Tax=Bradyrhizobium sp. IAR9 TaxID=2663841 RepID=UPI0015C81801|nr:hypothetical protein [Bradyrhizobium sp. IAR9]NYG44817.1 hypothetical protein [Bradyrhizobium sp. IAR9]